MRVGLVDEPRLRLWTYGTVRDLRYWGGGRSCRALKVRTKTSNALFDRQPVKTVKDGGNVVVFLKVGGQESHSILDALQLIYFGVWQAGKC